MEEKTRKTKLHNNIIKKEVLLKKENMIDIISQLAYKKIITKYNYYLDKILYNICKKHNLLDSQEIEYVVRNILPENMADYFVKENIFYIIKKIKNGSEHKSQKYIFEKLDELRNKIIEKLQDDFFVCVSNYYFKNSILLNILYYDKYKIETVFRSTYVDEVVFPDRERHFTDDEEAVSHIRNKYNNTIEKIDIIL